MNAAALIGFLALIGPAGHDAVTFVQQAALIASTQSDIDRLLFEVERLEELFENGLIPQRELDEATEELQYARLRLARAEQQRKAMTISGAIEPADADIVMDHDANATDSPPDTQTDTRIADLDAATKHLQDQQDQITRVEATIKDTSNRLDNLLNLLEQSMKDGGESSEGLHPFVQEANRYAGVPFVWGGVTSRGLDCSGLVLRVASRFGYRLPHSAERLSTIGTPVARQVMKPGDLVFFRDTYKPGISHVGIYLGKERFVHAKGTGIGVIVSRLDEPPYSVKFVGARRLRPQK